jgi:hypothetical protein
LCEESIIVGSVSRKASAMSCLHGLCGVKAAMEAREHFHTFDWGTVASEFYKIFMCHEILFSF